MNRGLLTFLIFTLCMYICVHSQQCTYPAFQGTVSKFNTTVNKFNDPNYFPTDFDAELGTILTESAPCFTLIESFVTLQDFPVSRITDDCVLDQTAQAAQWKADPCCNPELRLKQCCVPKSVNETDSRITAFKPALDTSCRAPVSVKPILNEFATTIKARLDRCDSIFKVVSGAINSQAKKMSGCFSIFSHPPKCNTDADCYGSGTCSKKTNKCMFTGPEDPNPVLDCMFAQVPEVTVRNIRTKFGFKGTTPVSEVRTAFKNATIALECQKPDGTTIPNQNQNQCLTQKVCNVPNNGTCPVEKPVCALCDPRTNVCDFIINELTTQQQCTSSGICLGGGLLPNPSNPNQLWNKATCENGTFKYCTAYDKCNEFNGCDATKCAATGECVGFPFLNSTCVFPYDYDNTTQTITCRQGRIFQNEGCEDQSTAYDTNQKCTAAGGAWYKFPTNKAECESHKACFDNEDKVFNPLPEAECTKCKLTFQSRYTWTAGVWTNSIFFQEQKWVQPAMIPANRYIAAINAERLGTIILGFLHFQAAPAFKSYMQCAFSPILDLITTISCDCGVVKGANGTCFGTPKDVEIGTQRVFAGLTGGYREPAVQLIIPNNTVDATKDVDGIVLSRRSNPDLAPKADISNYYDMFNIHFLNQANAVVGVSVSAGYSVKRASGAPLAAPIQLCINRDPKVVVPPQYTDAAFATKDGAGALVKTSVQLIGSDFSQKMCGNVQTTNTYYAAFFTKEATTSPGKSPSTPAKSPTTGSAATVFLTCLAIFFSVLGYMF